jgi:hypothetical protein
MLKLKLYLPNEILILIFNFLTLGQCKNIGVTCKQLYLIYQHVFDIYLKEQQNFDPNNYIFYDKYFKEHFKIKRIINNKTTKKYHFIEFNRKNNKGKYIRRKIYYDYNKKPYVRNLIYRTHNYNRYIYKYKIGDINSIYYSYCDKCFGFKYTHRMLVEYNKCGVIGCCYMYKNDNSVEFKLNKIKKVIDHKHNLCDKCRKIVQNNNNNNENIIKIYID